MEGLDLSLVPTDELFDALCRRFDHVLLVWARDNEASKDTCTRDICYKGWAGSLGLARWAEDFLVNVDTEDDSR